MGRNEPRFSLVSEQALNQEVTWLLKPSLFDRKYLIDLTAFARDEPQKDGVRLIWRIIMALSTVLTTIMVERLLVLSSLLQQRKTST